MERVISLTIDESRDGKRVYELLRRDLRLSAALIKRVKYLERGILLNGARVFVDAVARAGDLLEVMLDEGGASSEGILPVKGELDIVYEDDDLLILNKPAGMPVHPSRGHELDSLANVVMGRYAEMGKPFVFRAVNRLDRGTSGLMAVAKNAHAQERMKKQLGSAAFLRTYLAVCRGAPVPPDGTIDAPIGRRAAPSIERVVDAGGVRAVTHYETLRVCGDRTLLRLRLETGRTHQIRVHLSHIGHPLVGDFLYGREEREFISRPALHSAAMELVHPLTGKRLSFEAPLPEDIRRLLDQALFNKGRNDRERGSLVPDEA